MSELDKITNSFEETLKDTDLQNATIGLAESLTDSLLIDGAAKDIPIIGTIVGIYKAALGVRERLFLKKIIYFISELRSIPIKKRNTVITKIDSSNKYRTRVGEKLLFIIDKCEDHEKAQLISRLFLAFIENKINYSEFLRSASIIERAFLEDIFWFINGDWKFLDIEEIEGDLNSGLFMIKPNEINVRDQDDWKLASEPYIVEGGDFYAEITPIGAKIRELLSAYIPDNIAKGI